MSKNSKGVYRRYDVLVVDGVKGIAKSCDWVVEMIRCLSEVGDGA